MDATSLKVKIGDAIVAELLDSFSDARADGIRLFEPQAALIAARALHRLYLPDGCGMALPPKKKPKDDEPQMPFDEALRRVWSAPPSPNVRPKKKAAKKKMVR